MYNENNQGGSNQDQDNKPKTTPVEPILQKDKASYGWIWIVGIIIAVALVLFFLQRNVPQDENKAVEEVVTEEVDQDPLRLRNNGVYDLATPRNVAPSSIIGLDWIVSSAQASTAEHTAIHWGTDSLADKAFSTDTDVKGTYPNVEGGNLSGEFQIPAKFEANINAPKSGTIYLRAHAIINGENYWSKEKAINVNNK